MDKKDILKYGTSFLAVASKVIAPHLSVGFTLAEKTFYLMIDKFIEGKSFEKTIESQFREAFYNAKTKAIEQVKTEQQDILINHLNKNVFESSYDVDEVIEKAITLMAEYPSPDEIVNVANTFRKCFAIEVNKHAELCMKIHSDDIDNIFNMLEDFDNKKANVEQLPYRNILHNWFFLNPINQRGKDYYEGWAYTIDRWVISKNMTMKRLSSGVHLSAGETGGMMYQTIEHPMLYAGQQLTLSIKFGNFIYQKQVELPAKLEPDIEYGVLKTSFGYVYLRYSIIGLLFIIYLDAEKSVILQSIKLEFGKISTLSNDRLMDNITELLICQRFQIFMGENSVRIQGIINNHSMISCFLPLPMAIRCNPVATIGDIQVINPVTNTQETDFNFHASRTGTGIEIKAFKQNHRLTNAIIDIGGVLFDANL